MRFYGFVCCRFFIVSAYSDLHITKKAVINPWDINMHQNMFGIHNVSLCKHTVFYCPVEQTAGT